jgi:hypothetical protein
VTSSWSFIRQLLYCTVNRQTTEQIARNSDLKLRCRGWTLRNNVTHSTGQISVISCIGQSGLWDGFVFLTLLATSGRQSPSTNPCHKAKPYRFVPVASKRVLIRIFNRSITHGADGGSDRIFAFHTHTHARTHTHTHVSPARGRGMAPKQWHCPNNSFHIIKIPGYCKRNRHFQCCIETKLLMI